ncbi:MAG: NB-ARC domain-containing protein [Cyanobacteria bacterium P01_A01_bin.123]
MKQPQRSRRRRGVLLSPQGWQRLQDVLEQSARQHNGGYPYTLTQLVDLTGLSSKTLTRIHSRKTPIDRKTLEEYFSAFDLRLTAQDCAAPEADPQAVKDAAPPAEAATDEESTPAAPAKISWGAAPDVSTFYGRTTELSTLASWIAPASPTDRCRLVAVLGIGGVGKTTLVVKVVEQLLAAIEGEKTAPAFPFDFVIWRSLSNAPPLDTLLGEIIPIISHQQETQTDRQRVFQYLRTRRCLLILDNLETILQPQQPGRFRVGYEDYGQFLRQIGETAHQSCLIFTSREKPMAIASLEGVELPVRSLQLGGLQTEATVLLTAKGLSGSVQDHNTLIQSYDGNPLALKIVATSILDLFEGDIQAFLSHDSLLFNGVRRLLNEQFARISPLQQSIMYWLAINREWTTVLQLEEDLVPAVSRGRLLEALEALCWRSLVEKQARAYSQQPVVMEYVTSRWVEQVGDELTTLDFELFIRHPLIKTTVAEYINQSQTRLILMPVLTQFQSNFRAIATLEQQILRSLTALRQMEPHLSGYGGGNLINLCIHLDVDLTQFDFSGLNLWHTCLQGVELHQVNFENSNLAKSIFTQTFGVVFSVAFSPDSQRLVTGDDNGNLYLWNIADGQLHWMLQGHGTWVWCLAWSPDGETIASGSADQTIKLWHPETGECLQTFQGHSNWVRSIAWHPDGHMLASGSMDQTIKLWDVSNGNCLQTLQMTDDSAWSVAWSPDGQTLASGGHGQVVRLWQLETGNCVQLLAGHTSWIRAVDWRPDGQQLASGSDDQTVKVWDAQTGTCLQTFEGHSNAIWHVKWSPDGQTLASSAHDHHVRIWHPQTGQCRQLLQNHTNWVWSAAWSPNGQALASVSHDRTIRLWETQTWHCLKTWQGYTSVPMAVDWNPDGQTLATCSDDQTVRLWDVQTRRCTQILPGHANVVWTVAWSPDGQTLASGSDDCTVRLWHAQTGDCLRVLTHQSWVWSVAWSPDSQTLASGVHGQTVNLWDVQTGQCLKTWQGHDNSIRSVRWSPDGRMLATGSDDQTVKIWDVATVTCLLTLPHANWVWSVAWSPQATIVVTGCADHTVNLWNAETGECLATWKGHNNSVRSVAWSPIHAASPEGAGQIIASGSDDQTVKLWDVKTGHCLQTLQGHINAVVSVAWSPNGKTLISSSADETMRIWHPDSGECLATLRADRPYEGMNITGVTGLTEAQKATLKALGAVES